MSKPTYIYFNLRARGELPRLIAAAGKIDYTEKRISFAEWPGQHKSKTPYGQLPVLEVDGHCYAQKLAISLFFARKAGLYPTSGSPQESLKCDSILLFSEEILEQIIQARVDNHFHKKPETLATLKETVLPQKIALVEKSLKENGKGFLVGDKLSIADLSAFDVTQHVVDIQGKSYLDSYPLLKAHFDRIGKIEQIHKYVASRPKGDADF